MKSHTKATVQERWEAVEKEYAQTDLRVKFLASQCLEKGNVREFLEELQMKREELVQVGVDIDKKDYLSTIISSLPFSLLNFASAQLAATRMFSTTKLIEPDILMSLLMEEADRKKAQYAHRAPRKGKEEGEEPRDEALSSVSLKPRKGKGRENITCWNCDRKGHYSNECKDPLKKENLNDKGQKATPASLALKTNIAASAELSSEDGGTWSAELVDNEVDWLEAATVELKMVWGNHSIDDPSPGYPQWRGEWPSPWNAQRMP